MDGTARCKVMEDINMPKVSIVVPVYNVEKYLVQCLESLRQQTFKDIEIICIDDGSSDGSGSILDSFSEIDKRFIIIHKNNTGYGHSVNLGMSKATGDYIGILESDDFAKKDMIENLYNAALLSGADVVKGNYDFYFDNREEHLVFNEILEKCPYELNFNAYDSSEIFEVPASVWSALYKTSFLRQNKINFLETPGASYQDVSFSFKIFMYAKSIYCIKKAVLNYRFDNPNSSVHNTGKIFCICDEYNELENILSTFPLSEKKMFYQKMQLTKFRAYLWNFKRLAIPFQYHFLVKFSDEFRKLYEQGKLDLSMWEADEKNVLQEVIKDKDTFFSKYSKEYINNDWQTTPLINDLFEFDGLNASIEKYNTIYIYGAGVIGLQTWKYLKGTGFQTKVKGFIVSDGENRESGETQLPINYLSEIDDKGALVLVATKHNNRLCIINMLRSSGFSNILAITDRMRKYM